MGSRACLRDMREKMWGECVPVGCDGGGPALPDQAGIWEFHLLFCSQLWVHLRQDIPASLNKWVLWP